VEEVAVDLIRKAQSHITAELVEAHRQGKFSVADKNNFNLFFLFLIEKKSPQLAVIG